MSIEQRLIASNKIVGTDLEHELYNRAVAAYFRTETSFSPDAPSNASGVEVHGGKSYVVLRNRNGILAVYRVRNDGKLKRIHERWPARLKKEAS